MRRGLVILTLLAIAVGLSSFAMAQEAVQPTATKVTPATTSIKVLSLSGQVVSVVDTTNTLVVKDKQGQTTTFSVNPKAKITKAGQGIAFSKLTAGEQVMVKYTTHADTKVATYIRVGAPPSLVKAKTEKTKTEKKQGEK